MASSPVDKKFRVEGGLVVPDEEALDLIDQVSSSLHQQMIDFVRELKELAKAPQQPLSSTATGAEEGDEVAPKRGRRSNSSLLAEIYFSFKLPEICTENEVDMDKMIRALYGDYAREFLVDEKLQNWRVELKERVSGGKDYYFHHLTSEHKFRSKSEVAQFVLFETYPPKHTPKQSRKTKEDPASASASRKRSSRE